MISNLAAPIPSSTSSAPDTAEPALLTRAQVQRRLAISRETLLRWIRAGKFPRADVVVGLWKRWERSTVEAWIARHKACS